MTDCCNMAYRRALCLVAVVSLSGCQPSATSVPVTVAQSPTRPLTQPISKPVSDSIDDSENTEDSADIDNNDPGSTDAVRSSASGSGNSTTASINTGFQPVSPSPSRQTFKVLSDPRPLFKPQAVFSAAHEATCLALIGDQFPALELADVSGEKPAWTEVLGPRLTVVVFWSSESAYAAEQINRLERETVPLADGTGMRIVSINVGDSIENVADWTGGSTETVRQLVDPDGTSFARIATAKLPRTYVLDAAGRIIWMDIEYSSTTRRDLENAIRYFLKRPSRSPTS